MAVSFNQVRFPLQQNSMIMACALTTKCNIMNYAFDTNQRKCHPFYAIKQRNYGKETMLTYKCILNGHFVPLWGPIYAEFCRLRWRNLNHNPPDHPSCVQKIPYEARSSTYHIWSLVVTRLFPIRARHNIKFVM